MIKRFDFIYPLANILRKKQVEHRLSILNLLDCLEKNIKEILISPEKMKMLFYEIIC